MLIADFTPEGADTPAGAGFSALAGLIEALHNAMKPTLGKKRKSDGYSII